jgi:hypothetical protein
LFIKEEINYIKNILLLGVNTNEFRKITKEDADSLAYVIISSARSLELDLFMDNAIADLESKMDLMVDILINGLKK